WSARAPALWSIQSPGLLALTHSMLNPGDELDIGKTFKFHQESNTTLAKELRAQARSHESGERSL
ncbi:MAG: hypothetical protein Q8L45_04370, partial [Xanthomonadaceae bacterium]|nr:hypothetical protein [Xanthomonadaceae bacterium]MDZ4115771.1 hypothetical protein [Xanthomonadaceae bacterium]MDZ4378384.1 hypothetical protein [Xanthomonadaceae bacterium]